MTEFADCYEGIHYRASFDRTGDALHWRAYAFHDADDKGCHFDGDLHLAAGAAVSDESLVRKEIEAFLPHADWCNGQ